MEKERPTGLHTAIASSDLAVQKEMILSAIITGTDDTVISNTLQGIIISWNPAAERMFGYAEKEAVGKHISLIIPPDRLSEEDLVITNIANGVKVEHFETLRRTKDGLIIPISVTVSPVLDDAGRIIGASKIIRDISELKKAAEKQSRLAAIIDSSDDTILSKTLKGIITSWNKAAEKMFGYTEEEVLGKHISLIIPPERLDEETYIIGEVSKGNRVDHFQTVRLAKDGRVVHISLTVSPIVDDKGNIIGASKIARDISEQLAIQEENARLFEQVKALNEKKDEFIGLASHELKTPLTTIHGYLQILRKIVLDERGQTFLQKAGQQVKKVNALISDLLDVSKIEAGKLQLNMERFDMHQLTEEVIEMLSHNNKHFTIRLNSSVGEAYINGDPHRIEQVVINLLTNAIRYSPGTEQIIVHLCMNETTVKLGVQDFGMGIPTDVLNDIFSKFFRVDNPNAHISGLGIGLYLSQEIIFRHKGQIWVESELSKGSTFWITLPV
jgi:PAS domain S-box-containing protein